MNAALAIASDALGQTIRWLARSGQQRIFSASVQASLGKLARRPMSELRSEVESIRIHSAYQMEGDVKFL